MHKAAWAQGLRAVRRAAIAGTLYNVPLLALVAVPSGLVLVGTGGALAACGIVGAAIECSGDVSGGARYETPGGGTPANPPTLNVNNLTGAITPTSNLAGVSLIGRGGRGGDGADRDLADGGDAGGGQLGPAITVNVNGTSPSGTYGITTSGAIGIVASSRGGDGGTGGDSGDIDANGGRGGDAGMGGTVLVNAFGSSITTTGTGAHGIFAESVGGNGGNGGDATGIDADGGNGGNAAGGGLVTVNSGMTIDTNGLSAHGIFAQSTGGRGGGGGDGDGIVGDGGNGGTTAPGGTVVIDNDGNITTRGQYSHGILAQSVGGFGGNGGSGSGIVGFGSDGASAGPGGAVSVSNSGTIVTTLVGSHAIFAQSVGGGGGSGGSAGGLVALGAGGSTGGAGGTVTVVNDGAGTLTTNGAGSFGIFAQSVGGGGGDGGNSTGLASIGGGGSATSAGGNVNVTSSQDITTHGSGSHAIFAQSVGGGGGNGGQSVGVITVGGSGGGGGNAGIVKVGASGAIDTNNAGAVGVFAQSVGGGGGNGGNAYGGGVGLSFALGGSAAGGGLGGDVTVNELGVGQTLAGLAALDITTTGEKSHGIQAQSIGGGGGNGGVAVAVAAGGTMGNAAVTIGGRGGVGGGAGNVLVNQHGEIETGGDQAHGIFAQSVGGGGGDGGGAVSVAAGGVYNLGFSMGGRGGAGGNAGTVTVNAMGDITTGGNLAHGIYAQSVGGGGGNGGYAVSASVGSMNASVALGGAGSGGGVGRDVTVNVTGTGGTITTTGLGSAGILAQSVGGGGGNGGFAGGFGVGGGSIGIGLGGAGGAGSLGGNVVVTNANAIDTTGANSTGIFAQSVGGGGGNGGFSMAAAGGVVGISAAVGGKGGTGSHGGAVSVDNSGAIVTRGDLAYGIQAQSVGGGGGNGGGAVAFSAAVSVEDVPAGAVAVAVGGYAGSGGNGGDVRVTNTGSIETFGAKTHGLYAQSVGGGGGTGGFAGAGAIAIGQGVAISVGVGGKGGAGGDGGEVTVGRDALGNGVAGGAITTHAQGADGIHAQSIGGGGGDGGLAVGVNFATNMTTPGGTSLNIGVTVGGEGGGGGVGKLVDIYADQQIRTFGDNASGIFAQSIGGGGGDGGNAVTGLASLADTTDAASRTISVAAAIGGQGGAGGSAGTVKIENTGRIETGLALTQGGAPVLDYEGDAVVQGASAYGIFAQSIGGGGGIGGRANSINMVVGKGCGEECPEEPNKNVSLTASVGGDGGVAGNGGLVDIDNSGTIITHGAVADAIHAQSIGGGGGNGGNGLLGSGELSPVPVDTILNMAFGKTKTYTSLSVAVGGDNGASGHGGVVDISNTGSITTHGSNSKGIFAQSVGGGGGVGGTAGVGVLGTVGIGGKGGAAGDGGVVTVTNLGSGTIETFGVASTAIFAQSVGGGGGVAGNVDRFLAGGLGPVPPLNLGIGLAFGQGGGNGGDGKEVTVNSNGTIRTHGDSAIGIFAQSVGGGGGVLGNLGNDVPLLGTALNWAVGSNGDVGNSGLVKVDHDGLIETFGLGATGIFAQSAGGSQGGALNKGSAAGVEVGVTGSVVTHAAGTVAIMAHSKGEVASGDIAITLDSATGLVKGGATDDTRTGIGVWIIDGTHNSLTNSGEITTFGGVDAGWAILASGSGGAGLAGGGDEVVTNHGVVTGSFNLGGGTNSFTNSADGRLNTGLVANVGAGNLITNEGWLSTGGRNRVMTTDVTGEYRQTTTGTYGVDLDLALSGEAGEADLLNGLEKVTLDGEVDLTLLHIGQVEAGEHSVMIAQSASELDTTGLVLSTPGSVVAQYALSRTELALFLDYAVDFSVEGLNPNRTAIGDYINLFTIAGTSPEMEPVIEALFNIDDLDLYGASLDQLSPEPYLVNEIAAMMASLDFENSLMSCKVMDGVSRFAAEGQCGWAAMGGRSTERQATGDNLGYRQVSAGLSAGGQVALTEQLYAGIGLSYEGVTNEGGDRMATEGHRLQGGAVLKGVFGDTNVAATLTGGYGQYDVARAIDLPDGPSYRLEGEQEITYVAGHVRIGHAITAGNAYIRPSVDVGVTQVNMPGFAETGDSPVALEVAAKSETYVTVLPAIEVGGEIGLGEGAVLRPFARVGVLDVVLGNAPGISATFAGAADSVDGFTVFGDIDDMFVDVTLGLDLVTLDGAGLRLTGDAKLGETTRSYGGNLKLTAPF